jgi:hypothetical protein
MKRGNLEKMHVILADNIANYELQLNGEIILMNGLVGKIISLRFTQELACNYCSKKVKKLFANGACFPCSTKLAACDLCILKPELCHFFKGSCREPAWGEAHCMIPHYVYLANSSGLKVGITRHTQIPTRWIDQGAYQALPIIEVKNRLQSGIVEKLFSAEISDKTDWRKMLKGQPESIDLYEKRDELFELLGGELDQIDELEILDNAQETIINYPVLEYPQKITSLSFEKTNLIEGKLLGIKGQYLIFDIGVLNIRNHTGHTIEMEF